MRPFDPDEATPCRDPGNDWRWWISDDAADRDQAGALCRPCPVLAACHDHGRRNGEVGVWGGVDLGTKPRPRPRPNPEGELQ